MKNPTSKNHVKLTFLGGAGFLVEADGITVAIDPYLGGDAKPGFERLTPSPVGYDDLVGIDYLISTHGHMDHCEPALINYLAKHSSCRFFGPESSLKSMIEAGAPQERITRLTIGDRADIDTFALKAVYLHDPYEPHALGVVLIHDNLSILHAGDSHYSDDFKKLAEQMDIDIALLSSGLKLYMSPEEIFQAADDLGCKALVPIHWDIWKALYIPIEEIQEIYNKSDDHDFALIPAVAGNSILLNKNKESLHYEVCR